MGIYDVNAPPITYEIDGVQYISVLAVGNSLVGTKHVDKLYTFNLNGEGKVNTSDKGSDEEIKVEESDDTASAETDKGSHCRRVTVLHAIATCEQADNNGPDLQKSEVSKDKAAVIDRIKNGGSSMPAFEGTLTE